MILFELDILRYLKKNGRGFSGRLVEFHFVLNIAKKS